MRDIAGKMDDAGRRTAAVSTRMDEISGIHSEQNAAVNEVTKDITVIAGLPSANVEEVKALTDTMGKTDAGIASARSAGRSHACEQDSPSSTWRKSNVHSVP